MNRSERYYRLVTFFFAHFEVDMEICGRQSAHGRCLAHTHDAHATRRDHTCQAPIIPVRRRMRAQRSEGKVVTVAKSKR